MVAVEIDGLLALVKVESMIVLFVVEIDLRVLGIPAVRLAIV